MNIKKFLIPFLSILTLTVIFPSCTDNSVNNNNTATYPNIVFKAGSTYWFNNDTISQNGTYYRLSLLTTDYIQPYNSNYQGKGCYPDISITVDTVIHDTIRSAIDYYSYSQTDGKFYQFGAKKFFDTNQTATWDLVADFSQPMGTEIALYTITNLFGSAFLSANVTSKVVVDTVIVTTGSPSATFNCYRVSLKANVIAYTLSVGYVYIDYYIGYTPTGSPSNPSGRICTKIYPVNLSRTINFKSPGLYTILNRSMIPMP